jgi:hypothetical protein
MAETFQYDVFFSQGWGSLLHKEHCSIRGWFNEGLVKGVLTQFLHVNRRVTNAEDRGTIPVSKSVSEEAGTL